MPNIRKPEEQEYLLRETIKTRLFRFGATITGLGVAAVGVGVADYITSGGEDAEIIAAGYLPLTIGIGIMAISGIRTINQYDNQNQS